MTPRTPTTALRRRFAAILAVAALSVLPSAPARAEVQLDAEGRSRLAADVRLRLERDWDSQDAAGVERADRSRARLRARLFYRFIHSPALEIGVRLRTGSEESHGSPHITLLESSGNPGTDADFNFDQWYLKGTRGRLSGQAGRFVFPFWRQNELFWDDDATPAGLAGSVDKPGKSNRFGVRAGLFSPPDGMTRFHGSLAAAQGTWGWSGESTAVNTALGLFVFDGEPGAVHLRNGNGGRDYRIWVAGVQWVGEAAGRRLALGGDLMRNAKDYSAADPDPFTAANHDQTDGYVLSVTWGRAQEAGEWLLAYHYARIEALAVNASYAQDDWVRWGSGGQVDSSDLKGHEFRWQRRFTGTVDVVAHLYLVEAITSRQDGNRFRLDMNFRF